MTLGRAVHSLSKNRIKKFALQRRDAGVFYERGLTHLKDNFRGSINRFCDIAAAFRHAPRVLDAGLDDGLLLALLKMIGHKCMRST